jgi:hypothetical protein
MHDSEMPVAPTNSAYRRTFGAALVLELGALFVAYVVAAGVGAATIGIAIMSLALCVWAAMAPRAAAFFLLVFAAVNTLSFVLALAGGRSWFILLAPVTCAAAILARRALAIAQTLVDESHPELETGNLAEPEPGTSGSVEDQPRA